MSSCCVLGATGEAGSCIVCGAHGAPVSRTIVERRLRAEQRGEADDAQYYFCATPECDVVYFTDEPLRYLAREDPAGGPDADKEA